MMRFRFLCSIRTGAIQVNAYGTVVLELVDGKRCGSRRAFSASVAGTSESRMSGVRAMCAVGERSGSRRDRKSFHCLGSRNH
ncbi:unnamed protein product [Macrosiphum euphorbiae]|uniref:Uncharacterized protein n=1 Tax=Macrosiphum euphorbiae TaxID=13131 RepID=A0AAV0XRZ2_9HEMI|nr:unnamed protein product [Macrosiphum euphorbiae]